MKGLFGASSDWGRGFRPFAHVQPLLCAFGLSHHWVETISDSVMYLQRFHRRRCVDCDRVQDQPLSRLGEPIGPWQVRRSWPCRHGIDRTSLGESCYRCRERRRLKLWRYCGE